MREILLVIHRWLGISIGVFFGVASLTGAVLVFEPELNRLLGTRAAPLTAGDVGAEAVEAEIARNYPGARILLFRPPQEQPGFYRVDLRHEGQRYSVFLDAGSGRPVSASAPSFLLTMIRRAHTGLFIPRYGHWLVVFASALALIGMVSGSVLWWPGIRRFFSGFRVRARRGFYILNFDLHQAIGILALPLLIVMTVTGVLMPFEDASRRVIYALFLDFSPRTEPYWEAPRREAPAPGSLPRALSPAAVLAASMREVPNARPMAVVYPNDPAALVEVRMNAGGFRTAPTIARVLHDPYDGRVVLAEDPRIFSGADFVGAAGTLRYHVGGFDNLLIRILYFASCVAGGVLFPTGLVIWWLKRQRKDAAVERRRAAVTAS
jgi:uncharacterized iron-regulated membrane protein